MDFLKTFTETKAPTESLLKISPIRSAISYSKGWDRDGGSVTLNSSDQAFFLVASGIKYHSSAPTSARPMMDRLDASSRRAEGLSLPETKSSPLKIGRPKRNHPFSGAKC